MHRPKKFTPEESLPRPRELELLDPEHPNSRNLKTEEKKTNPWKEQGRCNTLTMVSYWKWQKPRGNGIIFFRCWKKRAINSLFCIQGKHPSGRKEKASLLDTGSVWKISWIPIMLLLLLLSCQTLCDPTDCSLPGFSVPGISQARILEWVAISSSRGSSRPRDGTCIFCIAGGFFTTEPHGKPSNVVQKDN